MINRIEQNINLENSVNKLEKKFEENQQDFNIFSIESEKEELVSDFELLLSDVSGKKYFEPNNVKNQIKSTISNVENSTVLDIFFYHTDVMRFRSKISDLNFKEETRTSFINSISAFVKFKRKSSLDSSKQAQLESFLNNTNNSSLFELQKIMFEVRNLFNVKTNVEPFVSKPEKKAA